MIFKYSLINLLRTPVKTLLFVILIVATTAFAVLGYSMYDSSRSHLNAADEQFATVAEVSYIGDNYPDDAGTDAGYNRFVSDYSMDDLVGAEDVVSYEDNKLMRAYIDDFKFSTSRYPYKGKAIISFRVKSVSGNIASSSLILPYYDGGLDLVSGVKIEVLIDTEIYDADFFVPDHYYLAHGILYRLRPGAYVFETCPFDTGMVSDEEYEQIVTKVYGYSLDDVPSAAAYRNGWSNNLGSFSAGMLLNGTAIDLGRDNKYYYDNVVIPDGFSDPEYNATDSGMIWKQIAASYDVMNNSVDAIVTDDCTKVAEFHQGANRIIAGRYYTDADPANVAVVGKDLADDLRLTIGDKVNLKFHYANQGSSYYDSYWQPHGFVHEEEYTIVGIYSNSKNASLELYIPDRGAEWVIDRPSGYLVGRMVINNGSGEKFLTDSQKYLTSQMTVSVYDQGYLTVAAPLNSMMETSLILLIGSVACGAAIVFLFAFLFVSKQRATVHTMLNLGAGERRGRIYLLTGSSILALLATGAGAVIGYFLSARVLNYAYKNAALKSIEDFRYSAIRTAEGQSTSVAFASDWKPVIISALVVFAVIVIFCLVFTDAAMRTKRPYTGKGAMPAIRRLLAVVKHALISLVRNFAKSTIVVIVCFVLVVMIMAYGGAIIAYGNEINSVYDASQVKGLFSSSSGKYIDGLLIKGETLESLRNTDYVSQVHCSYSMKYEYRGYFDSESEDPENLAYYGDEFEGVPTNPYEVEFFMAKVLKWSNLTFTNDLLDSPSLYYDNNVSVVYADGYDERAFLGDESVCVIPANIAGEYGVKLGDEIVVTTSDYYVHNSVRGFFDMSAEVVGVYTASTSSQNIFLPLSLLKTHRAYYSYDMSVYAGDEYESDDTGAYMPDSDEDGIDSAAMQRLNGYSTLNSAVIIIDDTRSLDSLRQYLEDEGYGTIGQLGKKRISLTLYDASLNTSVNGLIKVVGYMEAIYPVLFLLIAGIGFLVSYLLTKGRRAELAVIRSMGAGTVRTFFTFFIEQTLLCLLGAALGVFAYYLVTDTLSVFQLTGALIFVLCYYVGVMIAIMLMNRLNVLKILSAKD